MVFPGGDGDREPVVERVAGEQQHAVPGVQFLLCEVAFAEQADRLGGGCAQARGEGAVAGLSPAAAGGERWPRRR